LVGFRDSGTSTAGSAPEGWLRVDQISQTAPKLKASSNISARQIVISGRVQGVGFRPFVFRLANKLNLTGSVFNGSGKVMIHAEGTTQSLDRFEQFLIKSAPPLAKPRLDTTKIVAFKGSSDFIIRASESSLTAEIHIPPDLFTCDDCLAELRGPDERRFRYPFINCTQCGPRYTIINGMPYDRPSTTMENFVLCDACCEEYESPIDRRFHAQPLACPDCGPSLTFRGVDTLVGDTPKALDAAVNALLQGDILAVKGIGGYHLMCDASNDEAVGRLRARKLRPDKPLAVMFPITGEDGLDTARSEVSLDSAEALTLTAPERSILIARRRTDSSLSQLLAPGLTQLGVFLPYSPLHHLLLDDFGRALVATSGNLSGEPVISDNAQAEERLNAVADAFLHHDRPIARPADDSVVRHIAGQQQPIRLGRGIGPLEFELAQPISVPTLAVGGHLKNNIALAWGDRIVVSPHIGDLGSPHSMQVFENTITDLQKLYQIRAERLVCDLHPDYASTKWANNQNLQVIHVQHHHAHASALAGEHQDIQNWLTFAWDGIGYGSDGALWGGEAMIGAPGCWQRAASFRQLRLIGGDKAGREPWRSAAALMWPADKTWMPDVEGADLARQAWLKRVNTVDSSAVGRLCDAAASLVLGRHVASFEGQGPMELEAVLGTTDGINPIRLPLSSDAQGMMRSDWGPLVSMLTDQSHSVQARAACFHKSLAEALIDQAMAIRKTTGFDAVGLTGGVFQNKLLSELVVEGLARHGIGVRVHRMVPANDGGLSFGQLIEASASFVTQAIETETDR